MIFIICQKEVTYHKGVFWQKSILSYHHLMIQTLLTQLSAHYDMTQPYGCFVSLFAGEQLVTSHGSLETTRSLNDYLSSLDNVLLSKHQYTEIVCDIVTEIIDIDMSQINQFSPDTYGLFVRNLDDSTHGCLLPNTAGVTTMPQAYNLVSQKNSLTGQLVLSVFRTHRHRMSG